MGGFFGVASKQDCVLELFYGVEYHSHLGTRRAGMKRTEKTDLTVPFTILKIHHFVPNSTKMWER